MFVILTKNGPMFRDFGGQKWDPCLGIFCQNPTHLGGTSPYSVSMEVPPPGIYAYYKTIKLNIYIKYESWWSRLNHFYALLHFLEYQFNSIYTII